MERIQTFLQAAEEADSKKVLKTLFSRTIKEIGYHGFDAFSVQSGSIDNADQACNFYISDYGLDYVATYIGDGWLQMDPSMIKLAKTSQPFDYIEFLRTTPQNASIKWQLAVMKIQNVHQAWLMPFNIVGATRGVTCYMRGKSPETKQRFLDSKHEIQLMAGELIYRLETFHSIGQDLTPQENVPINLSAREVDCLHWAAKGKTNAEIAVILKISRNTVGFHLKNAFTKLGVTSRSNAVLAAIRQGIIEL